MTVVAVIGGGIAGLAAATALSDARPDVEVVVLEATGSLGGKLRSESVAGVPVDVGAEALLARRPEGLDALRAAGLTDDVITPTTLAAGLRVGGARVRLPAGTMMGIPAGVEAVRETGALTDGALRRVASEPDGAPLPPLEADVAVGRLVRERLGNEVVDRLVEPLLGGVYAGRADELSLRATMPALADRLAAGGSLVAAARAVTEAGGRNPGHGPVFVSVAGGLARLPQALAERGGFAVRTGVTVRAVRRAASGFDLVHGSVPDAEVTHVDAVVVAVPAAKAARLLREVAPSAAAELGGVESASVAIVTMAFRDVRPPEGSGLLVGVREGFAVKAMTFSSQKWPLATDGLTVLRASLGRAGENAVLQRDDDELAQVVRHELRGLAGIDTEPVDTVVTRWGGGLPQYAVGHVERVDRIRRAVAEVPGLAVCGATYDGVGIPACIASGRAAADRVLAGLPGAQGRQGE